MPIFRKNKNSKNILFKPIDSGLLKEYNKCREHGKKKLFCFVPFTNLYFNTEGNALSCCFNTKVVLGSYPENTVKEIWRSSTRKLLCEHLLHNDLNYGCDFCNYQINTGKFTNIKAGNNDLYASKNFKKYPKILEFELSNNCNLECIMCSGRVSSSIRKNREHIDELPNPYDDNFVHQLKPFIKKAREAKFFGGEPFLIPIYYKIWDQILKLNPKIKVYIVSNGTILNDKILNYINKGNFYIIFSVDSVKKDIYEKIRINADYEQVMNNIRKCYDLFSLKNKTIGISITPQKINRFEIPDLINFANSMQASIYYSFMESPKDLAIWDLPKKELQNLFNYYQSQNLSDKTDIEKKNLAGFKELTNQIKLWINGINLPKADHGNNFSKANFLKVKDNFDFDENRKLLIEKYETYFKDTTNHNDASIDLYLTKLNSLIDSFECFDEKSVIVHGLLRIDFTKSNMEKIIKLSVSELNEMLKKQF